MTVYRAVNRMAHIQEANRRKKEAIKMSEHESKYASKCKGGTNSLGPSERAENHPPLLDSLRLALTSCGCSRPGARGFPDGPLCYQCKRILLAIKQESKGHGRIDVRF